MASSGDGHSKDREPLRSHYYKVFRYGENGTSEEHYLEVLRDERCDRRRARTAGESLPVYHNSRLADRIRTFNRLAGGEEPESRTKKSSADTAQTDSRGKHGRGDRTTPGKTSPGRSRQTCKSGNAEPIARGRYHADVHSYVLDTRRRSTDRCHARLSIEMSVTDPAVVPVQNQLLLTALQALFIPSCPGICIERVLCLQDKVSGAVMRCEVRPTFWCRSYENCKAALFLSSEAKKKVKHERQFLLRALRYVLQTGDIAVFIVV
ncbi:Hypp2434 [Branchiostoma lanceolatum]|uniref:Hypp2434 protein n=1 Tax=Branchiostoma lanceolatum TaxID=7740 RepID=A0A8K0ET07_BRALA|nr:Hypp2434 [Branchiostoma lanceolatum]